LFGRRLRRRFGDPRSEIGRTSLLKVHRSPQQSVVAAAILAASWVDNCALASLKSVLCGFNGSLPVGIMGPYGGTPDQGGFWPNSACLTGGGGCTVPPQLLYPYSFWFNIKI
jgi:hypothetical protein